MQGLDQGAGSSGVARNRRKDVNNAGGRPAASGVGSGYADQALREAPESSGSIRIDGV